MGDYIFIIFLFLKLVKIDFAAKMIKERNIMSQVYFFGGKFTKYYKFILHYQKK